MYRRFVIIYHSQGQGSGRCVSPEISGPKIIGPVLGRPGFSPECFPHIPINMTCSRIRRTDVIGLIPSVSSFASERRKINFRVEGSRTAGHLGKIQGRS
jgi:hypothetical protein